MVKRELRDPAAGPNGAQWWDEPGEKLGYSRRSYASFNVFSVWLAVAGALASTE